MDHRSTYYSQQGGRASQQLQQLKQQQQHHYPPPPPSHDHSHSQPQYGSQHYYYPQPHPPPSHIYVAPSHTFKEGPSASSDLQRLTKDLLEDSSRSHYYPPSLPQQRSQTYTNPPNADEFQAAYPSSHAPPSHSSQSPHPSSHPLSQLPSHPSSHSSQLPTESYVTSYAPLPSTKMYSLQQLRIDEDSGIPCSYLPPHAVPPPPPPSHIHSHPYSSYPPPLPNAPRHSHHKLSLPHSLTSFDPRLLATSDTYSSASSSTSSSVSPLASPSFDLDLESFPHLTTVTLPPHARYATNLASATQALVSERERPGQETKKSSPTYTSYPSSASFSHSQQKGELSAREEITPLSTSSSSSSYSNATSSTQPLAPDSSLTSASSSASNRAPPPPTSNSTATKKATKSDACELMGVRSAGDFGNFLFIQPTISSDMVPVISLVKPEELNAPPPKEEDLIPLVLHKLKALVPSKKQKKTKEKEEDAQDTSSSSAPLRVGRKRTTNLDNALALTGESGKHPTGRLYQFEFRVPRNLLDPEILISVWCLRRYALLQCNDTFVKATEYPLHLLKGMSVDRLFGTKARDKSVTMSKDVSYQLRENLLAGTGAIARTDTAWISRTGIVNRQMGCVKVLLDSDGEPAAVITYQLIIARHEPEPRGKRRAKIDQTDSTSTTSTSASSSESVSASSSASSLDSELQEDQVILKTPPSITVELGENGHNLKLNAQGRIVVSPPIGSDKLELEEYEEEEEPKTEGVEGGFFSSDSDENNFLGKRRKAS